MKVVSTILAIFLLLPTTILFLTPLGIGFASSIIVLTTKRKHTPIVKSFVLTIRASQITY